MPCWSRPWNGPAAKAFDAVRQAAERRVRRGVSAFRSLVETYLADAHLASMETGCPVAALGSDMPRQSPAVREASAHRVRRLIAAVRDRLPASALAARPESVIAATMVGALQLARALGDNAEGRAVLAQAPQDAAAAIRSDRSDRSGAGQRAGHAVKRRA